MNTEWVFDEIKELLLMFSGDNGFGFVGFLKFIFRNVYLNILEICT